jgi:hypothetical protein
MEGHTNRHDVEDTDYDVGNQKRWYYQLSQHAIPVVIRTADAKALDEQRDWLHDLGIPVLSKPFEIDNLYRCNEQVLPDTQHNDTNPSQLSA